MAIMIQAMIAFALLVTSAFAISASHWYAKRQEVIARNRAHRNRLEQLNTTNSPLLRLPGELRNRIYELVLGGNVFPMTHLDLPRRPVNYRIFDFLLVCRQIHREARWTVFETNTFTFAFPPERLRHYETIYDSLSPRAKASIRCIRIYTYDYECWMDNRLLSTADGRTLDFLRYSTLPRLQVGVVAVITSRRDWLRNLEQRLDGQIAMQELIRSRVPDVELTWYLMRRY